MMPNEPVWERVYPEQHVAEASVTVGPEEGDLRGTDQRVIQGAIEYVASLGGGTVRLLPGTYELSDSVRLRSKVRLVGQGEGVVLRKDRGFETPLTLDGDYGEARVQVAETERWQPGMGITLGDDTTAGWSEVVATVTGVQNGFVYFSRPLDEGKDLLVSRHAWARHTFPLVSVCGAQQVVVDNLELHGAASANPRLNGCVGGALYAFRSQNVLFRQCRVREFNGDGISFQLSHDVVVERCEVTAVTGLGIHPGSGSQRPRVSGCRSRHNGEDGLFVCWRVRHGVFSDNLLEANGRHGLSIGHKDTDNLFEGNRIVANGHAGVAFRNEPVELAAHRNTLRRNTIENNGTSGQNGCGVRVDGATQDLLLEHNIIRCSPGGHQHTGIWLGAQTDRITLRDNLFEGHTEADVARAGERTAPVGD